MKEGARYVGRLFRGLVYLDEDEGSELLRKGYGRRGRNKVVLSPVEAAYLVFLNKLEVRERGKSVSFEELMVKFSSADERFFPKFLVYRDLREKGYVVREGYGDGIDFLVFDRGDFPEKPAKFRVIGVDEGHPVSVRRLMDTLDFSMLNKKELKLAVIERRGEVVYYTLERFSKERLKDEG